MLITWIFICSGLIANVWALHCYCTDQKYCNPQNHTCKAEAGGSCARRSQFAAEIQGTVLTSQWQYCSGTDIPFLELKAESGITKFVGEKCQEDYCNVNNTGGDDLFLCHWPEDVIEDEWDLECECNELGVTQPPPSGTKIHDFDLMDICNKGVCKFQDLRSIYRRTLQTNDQLYCFVHQQNGTVSKGCAISDKMEQLGPGGYFLQYQNGTESFEQVLTVSCNFPQCNNLTYAELGSNHKCPLGLRKIEATVETQGLSPSASVLLWFMLCISIILTVIIAHWLTSRYLHNKKKQINRLNITLMDPSGIHDNKEENVGLVEEPRDQSVIEVREAQILVEDSPCETASSTLTKSQKSNSMHKMEIMNDSVYSYSSATTVSAPNILRHIDDAHSSELKPFFDYIERKGLFMVNKNTSHQHIRAGTLRHRDDMSHRISLIQMDDILN